MSRIFFILLLFITTLIRGPLSLLLIIVKNLNSSLRRRIDFERKNLQEDQCRSFKKDLLSADYCFEVSSEGELEQVRPIIEFLLQNKKRIEILFASPSVEKKCIKLAQENIDQIRILRLPVVSFLPVSILYFQSSWQWVSAPKIVFCRYDFYPELLLFKFLNKKLILVSAASKKPSWYKNQAYQLFDIIVAANKAEELFFKNLFPTKNIFSFDFRVPRIFERVSKAQDTLKKCDALKEYFPFLESKSMAQKIILGSAWKSDLAILGNEEFRNDITSGKLHLLVVPHNLSADSINDIKSELNKLVPKAAVYEISNTPSKEFSFQALIDKPGVVVLNVGGILCELYTQFHFSYVGGGYERSIHSVLEPYLSGAQVVCGPKIHRSTEYDFIKDLTPREIHLLKNSESFYNLFKEYIIETPNQEVRNLLKENCKVQMKDIINEIELC